MTNESPWELLLGNAGVLQAALTDAEPALADAGLTDVKAFFLLTSVEQHPGPADLARALMLPRPTVTFLVKRAEAAGHLKRLPVPGDLRRFQLKLTPRGRRAMNAGRDAVDQAFASYLGRLSSAEAATFRKLIRKLAGAGE
ncbi:MAG: MarR family transcriptional regulator [Planctomycetota bacterium]